MKKMFILIKVVLLAVLLLLIPKIGTWVANLFETDGIDPDGAFMWISIHHVVQAFICLILIALIKMNRPINFRLGLGNKDVGIRYLKRFMIGFTIYTVIAFIVMVVLNSFQMFNYPLNGLNIAGYLGFQLLLSGPSEELIFRAFAMTMFATYISTKRVDRHLSYATVFAAIIFGIAHVQISLNPFEISYIFPQVIFAIALGYFYGSCYEKSNSVIYPMIMHSFTNVLMVGITIILSLVL